MRQILLSFLFVIIVVGAMAQRGDSLLLNETKLSRPLNVHRNQLRISGAYLLALSSTQFIGYTKMPSKETGRTRTFSEIDLDIKYGVTEHLQTRFVLKRTAEIITEPAFFDGFGTEFYIINNSQQKIGWEDPEFWIDFRLPFTGARTDVVLNMGSTLPFMKSGADQPSVRIAPSDIVFEGGIEFERISTLEYQNTGKGVTQFAYGIQLKHRFKHFAINAQSAYYLPLGTATADRWVLSSSGFDYTRESYTRQVPDLLTIAAGIEVQVKPWLNLALEGLAARSRNGWNEVEGEKILVPTAILSQASFSYDIIASKRLWIGQSLQLTIEAKDVYAPVLLTTSVKYNLFL